MLPLASALMHERANETSGTSNTLRFIQGAINYKCISSLHSQMGGMDSMLSCHYWHLAAWAPHKSPSPHSRPLSWTDLSQSDNAQWQSQKTNTEMEPGNHGKTILTTWGNPFLRPGVTTNDPTGEKQPPQLVPGWKGDSGHYSEDIWGFP